MTASEPSEHLAVVILAAMLDEEGMHPYDAGRDLVDEVHQPGEHDAAWSAIEGLLSSRRFLSLGEDEDSDFARAVAWTCTHYLLKRAESTGSTT